MTGNAPWEFGSHSEFYLFCREERQLCALLAHLLMQKGQNLERFLALFDKQLQKEKLPPFSNSPAAPVDKAQIYLEFAYLRDRWN